MTNRLHLDPQMHKYVLVRRTIKNVLYALFSHKNYNTGWVEETGKYKVK